MPVTSIVIVIIAFALIFDLLKGFHHSANSIATIVSTRVLTPLQAVAWAAFFNFVSAFTFGTAVANTVGTLYVILAGVLGAIVWDLLTWWLGLPISSSRALIGGYAGAAMARAVFERGPAAAFSALIPGKWLTRLKPRTGFCAETGAAVAILFATHLGLTIPASAIVAGIVFAAIRLVIPQP